MSWVNIVSIVLGAAGVLLNVYAMGRYRGWHEGFNRHKEIVNRIWEDDEEAVQRQGTAPSPDEGRSNG
jgi:hypothetical protein